MNPPTLPQWVADIVANPPQSGEGFHLWLFRAARALWQCGRSEYDIRSILENAASTCGRFVPRREIDDAIHNSQVSAFQPLSVTHHPWPSLNSEQREAVIQETRFTLCDLWEASSVRFEDNNPHTEEIIDVLLADNPLLCVGQSQSKFCTLSREEWRGTLARLQLIVPSPMTARLGLTKEGEESAHALSITGLRRFLVIEQDIGSVDEQVAILWHLASLAPFALDANSGHKSVHGWFYCSRQDEEKILRPFMRYAISLGACSSTWTKSQFVWMPDGRRDNARRQAVYYFRPEVVK